MRGMGGDTKYSHKERCKHDNADRCSGTASIRGLQPRIKVAILRTIYRLVTDFITFRLAMLDPSILAGMDWAHT